MLRQFFIFDHLIPEEYEVDCCATWANPPLPAPIVHPPLRSSVPRSRRRFDMAELTDEQAAIYDRQIRIWGAGVQRRLMDAKVLVLGCTPLAAEVTKNFILAGVGSLTLIDDAPVDKMPMTFLSMYGSGVSAGDTGTTAALYAAGLQEMNPMVQVTSQEGKPNVLPDKAFLRGFNLLLCFGQDCAFLADANDLCRECNVKFMCAVSRGPVVWGFADLLKHDCGMNIDQNSEGGNRQVSLEYVPMREVVRMSWTSMPRLDQRQVHGFLGPWTVIAQLEMAEKRQLQPEDSASIDERGQQRMSELNCPEKFWNKDMVSGYYSSSSELAPANAIAGGFLANDVVRVVSHVGLPMYNVFYYSIIDNVAQVHNLSGGQSVHA